MTDLEQAALEKRQIEAATKAWYATKLDCTLKSPTSDPDPYILAIVKAVRETQ